MKRLICILLLLALLAVPVNAAQASVVDEAGLLTQSELESLTAQADELYTAHQFSAVIVTMDSIGGADPWAWANDYYDGNGYGYGTAGDGMMLLLVMDTRQWAISTCGSGISIFSEYDQDRMMEEILSDLSGGDYYAAFSRWLELCGESLEAAEADYNAVYTPEPEFYEDYGYEYDYNYDYGYSYDYGYDSGPNHFLLILVSLGLGFVVSMIPMGMLKKEIHNVSSKAGASDYTRPGSMQVTTQTDRFLYTNTHRVRRAQQNPSGRPGGGMHGGGMHGGGHHSSGGRSHGGSRGRF